MCAGSSPPNPRKPKETMMRFCIKQHQFYWGIELHARLLAICIVDQAGAVVLQTQIADKQLLLKCLMPLAASATTAITEPRGAYGNIVASRLNKLAKCP